MPVCDTPSAGSAVIGIPSLVRDLDQLVLDLSKSL
jgi:hypothetical protein